MADLAVVFHWSLPVLDEMGLTELMDWHARAAARHGGKTDGDGTR